MKSGDVSQPISLPDGETTMQVEPGYGWIPAIRAPTLDGPNVVTPAALLEKKGMPVRAYICKVCGYMEFYAGEVVAPQTWRRHVPR